MNARGDWPAQAMIAIFCACVVWLFALFVFAHGIRSLFFASEPMPREEQISQYVCTHEDERGLCVLWEKQ